MFFYDKLYPRKLETAYERVNESYRFSYTMKKKMIIFSEVNGFKKLHPHGLPSPKQMFQISNFSPIRTTELKLDSQKYSTAS